MTSSISSDVTILDRDRDGLIRPGIRRRNGGNLWRIDINDANPANWAVKTVLRRFAGVAAADKRKFQFPPDVVFNRVQVRISIPSSSAAEIASIRSTSSWRIDTTCSRIRIPACWQRPTRHHGSGFVQCGQQPYPGRHHGRASGSESIARRGQWLDLVDGNRREVISSSVTLAGTTFFNTNQPTSVATAVCSNNLRRPRGNMRSASKTRPRPSTTAPPA
jgi:type IV pilus assembly protein PilY1